MKKFCGVVLAMAMMSSSVLADNVAATISDLSGKVLINKGKGFVPAVGAMSLNVGDKVLVGENSFAVVSYAECAVSVSAPSVFSIAKVAPCINGSADATVIQPVNDDVVGGPTAYFPLFWFAALGALTGFALMDGNNNPVSVP